MSSYANHYADGAGRSRRRICWTGTSLLAAACLGLLTGITLTAVLGAAARQGEARPVNCLIRSPAVEGLLPASITNMTGVCRVER